MHLIWGLCKVWGFFCLGMGAEEKCGWQEDSAFMVVLQGFLVFSILNTRFLTPPPPSMKVTREIPPVL